jgi:hypothetical protein
MVEQENQKGLIMKEKLNISLNGENFELETNPITIICKAAKVVEDIQYGEDVIIIGSPQTLQHLETIRTLHPSLLLYLCYVFNKDEFDIDKFSEDGVAYTKQQGTGFQHVVGMIDMTLKAMDGKKEFVIRYPEAHLHPSKQANLADLFIVLLNNQIEAQKMEEKFSF